MVRIQRAKVLFDVNLLKINDQTREFVDIQRFHTITQPIQNDVEHDRQIFEKLLIGRDERIIPNANISSDNRSNVRVTFLLNG